MMTNRLLTAFYLGRGYAMSAQPFHASPFSGARFFVVAGSGLAFAVATGLMPVRTLAQPGPLPTHTLYDDPSKVQCTSGDQVVWVNIGVAYYLPGTPGFNNKVGTGGFACKSLIINLGKGYLEGAQALTNKPWPAACASGDPVVWGNKTSGAYYLPGTPGYNAKIGSGGFACKSDLDKMKWTNGDKSLTKDPWPAACVSGDPVVWVNNIERVYYLPGSPGYNAKVGSGGFACKADVVVDQYFDGDSYRTTKSPWPAACAAGDPVVWVVLKSDWSDYSGVTYFLPDTSGYNAKVGTGGFMCKANLLRWFPNAVALTSIPTPRPSSTAGAGGNTWSATAVQFRGQNGTRHIYTCPQYGYAYPVIGTFSYADTSSVCTAAVHAGLITFHRGGTVTIEIRAGLAEYFGMKEHGVTSRAGGRSPGSFVFVRS